MTALRNDQILEDLYVPETSHIGLDNLATALNVDSAKLMKALKVDRDTDELDPSSTVMQKWLSIFNHIIKLIQQTEPEITKERAFVKIRRWLNLPSVQLGNSTPMQFMLRGKSKQVITILEQLINT